MDIVALFQDLVNGLLKAEEEFFSNPRDLSSLEKATKTTTDALAAQFLSGVLSSLDRQIYNSNYRKAYYNAQRIRQRSLVSLVGDLTFDCTLYRKKGVRDGGYVSLLPEVLGLEKHERFTEEAEVLMLTEALKTSYAEAARIMPSKQEVSKTTVMNKIHSLAEEMPMPEPEEKETAEYLYVEADEDHVAEQHGGRTDSDENKSFISKLIYVYKNKQEVKGCSGRKELTDKFYFSGLYPGPEGNEKLWNRVRKYLEDNYDLDTTKHVYISGDAAPWIKSGVRYIDKAVFCADKYHLMKYVNTAAAQMGKQKKNDFRNELWHLLNSKERARERFDEYTKQMLSKAKDPDKVEDLRAYALGNWAAVRRMLRNKNVNGCSAESHVSHVLSDRLSSRPMGWSQTGADRMSKLRCHERNYGRDKIIDLVRYSRDIQHGRRTGTDEGIIKKISLREVTAEHYDQARSYIERIQATIPGDTVRKSASIITQLKLL